MDYYIYYIYYYALALIQRRKKHNNYHLHRLKLELFCRLINIVTFQQCVRENSNMHFYVVQSSTDHDNKVIIIIKIIFSQHCVVVK